jgi:hypothetical protein
VTGKEKKSVAAAISCGAWFLYDESRIDVSNLLLIDTKSRKHGRAPQHVPAAPSPGLCRKQPGRPASHSMCSFHLKMDCAFDLQRRDT